MELKDMRRRIEQLHEDLKRIVDRDAEQELDAIVLPRLGALIRAAKALLPVDDPVQSLSEFITMEAMLADDTQPRGMAMLLAVGQLRAALGPEPATSNLKPATSNLKDLLGDGAGASDPGGLLKNGHLGFRFLAALDGVASAGPNAERVSGRPVSPADTLGRGGRRLSLVWT